MTLLEKLRLDARVDRPTLAEKSGIAIRTIRALESGSVANPTQPTLTALADALTATGRVQVAVSDLALDFRTQKQAA